MLAKRTAKNQVTLPKAIVQAVGDADYYDVSTENGRIILTPVRRKRCFYKSIGYYRRRCAGYNHMGKKSTMNKPPRVVIDMNVSTVGIKPTFHTELGLG